MSKESFCPEMHRDCLIKTLLQSCQTFQDAERARKFKLTECTSCRSQLKIDEIRQERKE
jgi:hypothetical protein